MQILPTVTRWSSRLCRVPFLRVKRTSVDVCRRCVSFFVVVLDTKSSLRTSSSLTTAGKSCPKCCESTIRFLCSLVKVDRAIFISPLCPNPLTIGASCNISATPCDILNPCQNNGTCRNTNATSSDFFCLCPVGFGGPECQNNEGPCQANTCWNAGNRQDVFVSEILHCSLSLSRFPSHRQVPGKQQRYLQLHMFAGLGGNQLWENSGLLSQRSMPESRCLPTFTGRLSMRMSARKLFRSSLWRCGRQSSSFSNNC